MLAPGPRPTAPGSGSEFRPWNAHPVAVITTQQPMANTRRAKPDGPAPPRAERPHRRRADTRAIIAVALRPATASLTRWAPGAVVVASVWTAGAAAASPRPVSPRVAPPPAAPRDHRADRCRPTPRAGSRVARVSGPRRRVPGAVRCRGSWTGPSTSAG